MKYITTLILSCIVLQFACAQFGYINPVPGSEMHNPQTTIILKNGSYIDRESVLDKTFIEIVGSLSGKHQWSAKLSDDNKTIVINPNPVFKYGEVVFITVHSSLKKDNGEKIDGTSFNFKIRNEITNEETEQYHLAELYLRREDGNFNSYQNKEEDITYPLDSMPTF